MLLRLLKVVFEPAAVTALTQTIVIVHAQSPRTGIEHLVGIGIADVLVEDILREFAVEQEEL